MVLGNPGIDQIIAIEIEQEKGLSATPYACDNLDPAFETKPLQVFQIRIAPDDHGYHSKFIGYIQIIQNKYNYSFGRNNRTASSAREEFTASSGVLDMAFLPSAVDLAVCDETVGSFDEDSVHNSLVSHGMPSIGNLLDTPSGFRINKSCPGNDSRESGSHGSN
jgi:hypothetical protein